MLLGISVPGQVPGNMYTDLMRAGVIDDPYFRFNDIEYRWVHYDDWTYSTVFEGMQLVVNIHHKILTSVYQQY